MGFIARGIGWVGPEKLSPERQAEIEAASLAAARERAERLNEAARLADF